MGVSSLTCVSFVSEVEEELVEVKEMPSTLVSALALALTLTFALTLALTSALVPT